MNKLIHIVLFLFYASVGAQDTSAVALKEKQDKVLFTQKDIKVDNDTIEERHFENNFKTKYQSDDFVYEIKLKEKNAWDRFKEWLSETLSRFFSFGNKENSMQFVELLFRIIAALIILVVIYLIVKSIMNKEGQWIFGKNSDKKIIRYDEIEKNLHLVDFEKLIKQSIQSGERRLSIRYYYLWLLKKMSEKQIIEWDAEKTNSDYVYEIKNEQFKNNFNYLSYLYNYIWYGEFDIDDVTFEKAKASFEKTIQSI